MEKTMRLNSLGNLFGSVTEKTMAAAVSNQIN